VDELRALLLPWYLQIKFVHLFTVGLWSFSTVVAYRNYVLPAFRAWSRKPDDPRAIAIRDNAMERFDDGVIVEHVAFPLVLLSGLTMVWLADWPWHGMNWLALKLAVVVLVFIPVEIADYYLAHFGGRKKPLKARGETARHEAMTRLHWQFLRISSPMVLLFVPLLFYLAVTKPVWGP
jgi:hypothetical protein